MTTRIDIEHQSLDIDFSTFPDSDGLPMAETEINLEQMIDLILQLRQAVEPRGHHAGGNLLIYYDPADGHRHVSPDVFVALDAGPALRRSWKTWEEGKFPEVVMEIASPSTRKDDIGDKVTLYGELGTREYYIFDPMGDLRPAYRGYRRRGGRLVPVLNPTGQSIFSPTLDLELRVVSGWLRVIDPRTKAPYPLPAEAFAQIQREMLARRAAEERAEREAQARREEAQARREAEARAAAAESEAARLRALLAQRMPPESAE